MVVCCLGIIVYQSGFVHSIPLMIFVAFNNALTQNSKIHVLSFVNFHKPVEQVDKNQIIFRNLTISGYFVRVGRNWSFHQNIKLFSKMSEHIFSDTGGTGRQKYQIYITEFGQKSVPQLCTIFRIFKDNCVRILDHIYNF